MKLNGHMLCAIMSSVYIPVTIASPPDLTASGNDKPNFIFLLADDWGWGDNAFNVGKHDPIAPSHTPALDALASTGVIFSDFHTASPVCSPSRAGFMTGRDPSRFRIHTALNHNWTANAREGRPIFWTLRQQL